MYSKALVDPCRSHVGPMLAASVCSYSLYPHYLFICVIGHRYVGTCVSVHTHVHTYVWRSEVDVGDISLSYPAILFTGPLASSAGLTDQLVRASLPPLPRSGTTDSAAIWL